MNIRLNSYSFNTNIMKTFSINLNVNICGSTLSLNKWDTLVLHLSL